MFEYKFGGMLGKNIVFNGQSVFIGKREIKLEDQVTIFHAEPTTFSSGYVFFSFTGKPPISEMSISTYGFKYSKKQQESANELLSILRGLEAEFDFDIVKTDQSLGNIRMDDVSKSADIQKQRKEEKQRLKCPKCKSTNLQHAGNKKKGFSVGKAVGGAVLTGGIGTLAGFAGKKGKKENFVCMNCGKRFTT